MMGPWPFTKIGSLMPTTPAAPAATSSVNFVPVEAYDLAKSCTAGVALSVSGATMYTSFVPRLARSFCVAMAVSPGVM